MTNEYIKMILALDDEFFKRWEWNDGDQVYLSEDIDEYSCSENHGLYTIFDGLIADPGVNYTENWMYLAWAVREKKIRPVPSQEQLQNYILLKNSNINGLYHLHKTFNGWVTVYLIMNTFANYNQAWLAFAVSMILNLEWNGTSWEKR